MVLGSVAVRIVNMLLGALAGVVISRVLEPEGRGAYAVVVTLAGTAIALSHLSVEQAHLSMWHEREKRRQLAANAVILAAVLGSLAAGGAYLVVQLLGQDRMPVYSDFALIVALAAVPSALLVLYSNSLAALASRVDRLNRGLLLAAAAQTLVLLGLAAVGRLTVTAVVVVWAAATALPLVSTLPILRPRRRELSLPVLREEVARGLRYHAGVALLFLLFRVDIFLVNGFRSTEEVGLYALAVTLAELVYLLSDSVAQAIVSRQAAGNATDAVNVTALAIRLTLLGAAALVVLLAAAGPFLLPIVYGEAFRGSVPAFLVLLPGVLTFAVGRPVAALMAARGRPGIIAGLSAAAFVMNLALGVLLIPSHGIVGAALASSLAYGLLCVGYLMAARRVAGCAWSDFVPRVAELERAVRGR